MLDITTRLTYYTKAAANIAITRLICITMMSAGIYNHMLAYNFRAIGKHEGLSQLSVLGIHQDRLGRMWFGTEEGLNLYDGNNIRVFNSQKRLSNNYQQTDSILGNSNYPIVEDSEGNIFFRSDNALIKFDIRKQIFSTIANKGFFTLTSANGQIWLGLYNSIFKVDNDTLQLAYKLKKSTDTKCLHVQGDNVWLGSEKELIKINIKNNTQHTVLRACVWSIYEDSEKYLWIATRKNGIYRVSPQNEIEHIDIPQYHTNVNTPNEIRCFTEEVKGDNMWIGTFNGLICYNKHTHKYSTYTTRDGMSHNSVYALYTDKNNNIWIGTYYGGVNYFNPEDKCFQYFSKEKLTTPFIGSMIEDNDKNLWVCTEGGGLIRYNPQNREFTKYTIQWTKKDISTIHPNLKTVCLDKESNMLYIGTTTGGLCRYSLTDKTFMHYNLNAKNQKMLGTNVDKICHYGDYLFLQVRSGIYKMHIPTEKITPLFPGKSFHNMWVRTFATDSRGNIWISGYHSLQRINFNDPDNNYIWNYDSNGLGRYPVTCIAESPSGDIYIGTRGSGIYRYNDIRATFDTIDERLSDIYCYDINFSKTNKLMILTDSGIFFVDISNSHLQELTIHDYLEPLKAINIGCKTFVAQDSTIYVGGTNGLIAFSEKLLENCDYPSDIYVSSLELNGQDINPRIREIALSEKRNDISLTIGTTQFNHASRQNKYLYRLKGHDNEWKESVTAKISYQNLPPGDYELIVKENKPCTKEEAMTLLYINDETNEAYIYFGIIILIIASVAVFRIYSMKKSKKKNQCSSTDSSSKANEYKEENVCSILENIQKGLNRLNDQSITFIYTHREEGDLYYTLNKSAFVQLQTSIINFVLVYLKENEHNIEIIANIEKDILVTNVIDYNNRDLTSNEQHIINALAQEDYETEEIELPETAQKEIKRLRELLIQNNATINIQYSKGYGIILTTSVYNTQSCCIGNKQFTSASSTLLDSIDTDHDFIKQIDNIILQNISDDKFNIGDMVSSIYMSRTAFYLKFKEETGFSPNEYLINFRMSYARDLLVNKPELQISDVAYQSGFSSPRYFGRCFKKRYGSSPVSYRKNYTDTKEV